MKEVKLKAYGKVNLGLDVTGQRPDGYHLVKMVMQTVNIFDEITVTADSQGKKTDPGIIITCDKASVPTDERNLAYKAADIICRKYDITQPLHIDIVKNIPMEAGMAGGSADAAAVIKGMNDLFGLNMTPAEMDDTALKLGADVPFCLRQGTYLAEGIGEKLTRLPDIMHCFMVLIKPQISVSTPWAYKALDQLISDPDCKVVHPDLDELIKSLETGDLQRMTNSMGNILEEPVIRKYPEIGEIKKKLVDNGALAALMSGSGSVVFGIFTDPQTAEIASTYFGGEKYGKFKVEF